MNYLALARKYWWVIAIAVALIALVLFIVIRRRRREGMTEVKVRGRINQLLASGMKPTFSEANYATMADNLEDIFQGFDVFFSDDTDEAVDILLEMQNELDVLYLVKAYQKRNETWFGIIPDGVLFFGSDDRKTLPEAVRDDLSAGQIASINDDYAEKGINWTW